MDGKGCWRDNIFVERLWKTIKYEEVYLRAYGSVTEARIRLAKYIDFYNQRRPHRAIGRVPPDHRYYESLPAEKAA
jgi:putative transposase